MNSGPEREGKEIATCMSCDESKGSDVKEGEGVSEEKSPETWLILTDS